MTTVETAAAPRTSARPPTEAWPAFTVHTSDDVVVAAVALTRLVKWCGTPSVHTSGAAIPGAGGYASATEKASVVVSRVVAVEWRSDLKMHVSIDADLSGCRPVAGETRVIGRQATVHYSAAMIAIGGPDNDEFCTRLPSDVVVDDLVVVPCAGATLLHEVKPG